MMFKTSEQKTERFQVESADGYGFFVIDTAIEQDGETPANVFGSASHEEAQDHADQLNAHEAGDDCGHDKCQTCCAHDERDHGICLDCEHEEDPGRAIDRAMDYYEGDR